MKNSVFPEAKNQIKDIAWFIINLQQYEADDIMYNWVLPCTIYDINMRQKFQLLDNQRSKTRCSVYFRQGDIYIMTRYFSVLKIFFPFL